MIDRPDWKVSDPRLELDLSTNIHYDKILNEKIKQQLDFDGLHNYPNQYILYKSISDYYNIPLQNLTIGFGAGEIISRCIENFIDHLYIVSPTFEMVKVYCEIHQVPYTLITIDEVFDLPESAQVYIANPSGLNGESYDVSSLKFKTLILDEAYGDWYIENSRLHENKDWLIIVKTLSKSLGLAGIRVGFCKAAADKTSLLQSKRNNFITSSYAVEIIPKVIDLTTAVILRMERAKKYIETTYDCKNTVTNYVLFKEPNKLTDTFGYKLVDGHYRMALTNYEIISKQEKL